MKAYLSLIEELERTATEAGTPPDEFCAQFDYFFEAPPEHRTYVVKTPQSIIFARQMNPGDEDTPEDMPGPTWMVWYASDRSADLAAFFAWAPYPAEYVAFARPLKGRKVLRYFPWERIKRLCEKPPLYSGS